MPATRIAAKTMTVSVPAPSTTARHGRPWCTNLDVNRALTANPVGVENPDSR